MANKFPDEYRDTLIRLVKQMAQEARYPAIQKGVDYEALLARISEPGFGLCEKCGAVLSLARVIRNFDVRMCEAC
jgi:RNA polymerase-binding transcription factor DksA